MLTIWDALQLVEVGKKEIVQAIFNNIFYHKMAPVGRKEFGKRSQVAVGLWLLIHMLQNGGIINAVFFLKLLHQLIVERVVDKVLQHFFTQQNRTL